MADSNLSKPLSIVKKPQFVGSKNPNWKGGLVELSCEQCGESFAVKHCRAKKARFCSMRCANVYQSEHPDKSERKGKVSKNCRECSKEFQVFPAHVGRKHFCSKPCQCLWRSRVQRRENNKNWYGGLSFQGYPWQFRALSKKIILRDGVKCQNPACPRTDWRMTTHHIDYDKMNLDEMNLICLCSSCNSKANTNREKWTAFYQELMRRRMETA